MVEKKKKDLKQKQKQSQKQIVNINIESKKKTKKKTTKKTNNQPPSVPSLQQRNRIFQSTPMISSVLPINNNELLNEIRNITSQNQILSQQRIPVQTTDNILNSYRQGIEDAKKETAVKSIQGVVRTKIVGEELQDLFDVAKQPKPTAMTGKFTERIPTPLNSGRSIPIAQSPSFSKLKEEEARRQEEAINDKILKETSKPTIPTDVDRKIKLLERRTQRNAIASIDDVREYQRALGMEVKRGPISEELRNKAQKWKEDNILLSKIKPTSNPRISKVFEDINPPLGPASRRIDF